jgi:hypothetical protein
MLSYFIGIYKPWYMLSLLINTCSALFGLALIYSGFAQWYWLGLGLTRSDLMLAGVMLICLNLLNLVLSSRKHSTNFLQKAVVGCATLIFGVAILHMCLVISSLPLAFTYKWNDLWRLIMFYTSLYGSISLIYFQLFVYSQMRFGRFIAVAFILFWIGFSLVLVINNMRLLTQKERAQRVLVSHLEDEILLSREIEKDCETSSLSYDCDQHDVVFRSGLVIRAGIVNQIEYIDEVKMQFIEAQGRLAINEDCQNLVKGWGTAFTFRFDNKKYLLFKESLRCERRHDLLKALEEELGWKN